MDRMPRLRRKPKPPAMETSVGRAGGDAPSPAPPPRKSPFRSFKMRASAKRARGAWPADQHAASPVVAVVAQPRPASRPAEPARPDLPAFLTLSTQEMDRKFHEIAWAEHLRLADAHRNQAIDDYKWGHYQQLPSPPKGAMDRYTNIRPWNYNRVKLQVPDNEFDYVNASAVSLESQSDKALPPLRYIAMQGPTEPSFDHVWRMVAEQIPSPAVIVQLTTMLENGFVKCHQYFPHSEHESTWTLNHDDVWRDGWSARLTFVSLDQSADGAIERRKLLLDVHGEHETRVVWHFLYRRWPDFGVPNLEDMDSFLELMKLSRDYSAPSGPRIVHCSAGVGRTGTFICLEHLIRELETGAFEKHRAATQTPDLIFDTVESLRRQRRGMVQGEIQYHFIYHVVRKLWRQKYGVPGDDAAQPAAKRRDVADPFTDETNDGPAPAPEAVASVDASA